MNTPVELQSVLVSDADTLSGAVRFVCTRVPVQALLDSVDSFLEGFPGVTREQVEAVISHPRFSGF